MRRRQASPGYPLLESLQSPSCLAEVVESGLCVRASVEVLKRDQDFLSIRPRSREPSQSGEVRPPRGVVRANRAAGPTSFWLRKKYDESAANEFHMSECAKLSEDRGFAFDIVEEGRDVLTAAVVAPDVLRRDPS